MSDLLQKHYKIPESVLVVIHTAELEVLLLERTDHPGFWQSVTGSRDSLDEPLSETAVREVSEETGILISPQEDTQKTKQTVPLFFLHDWQISNVYDIYPRWQHRYAPHVTHNTEHIFSLQVPRDIPLKLAPREHLRFIWLPWEEAAKRCFSWTNAQAILQLPARLKNEK